MTPEDNKYGYDELRWLAQDTHKRRRRTMWWTAGLVVGAMTLATAYVSRDQQPNSSSNPSPSLGSRSVNVDLGDVSDSLKEINRNLVGIREALAAQQPVSLSFSTGGPLGPRETVPAASTNVYANQVVWLVEGSRRFPMAQGDILWIPEADRWLKLDSVGTEPAKGTATRVEVWGRNSPPPTAERPLPTEPLPVALPAKLNTSDCVAISSRGLSDRAAFRGLGYVDIEVLFYEGRKGGECPLPPSLAPNPQR